MALAARSATKAGYYDSVGGKVHTGVRMEMGQNSGPGYEWSGNYPWLNHMKHGRLLSDESSNPGTVDANGYIDCSTSGAWNWIIWVKNRGVTQTTYVIKWEGTGTCTFSGGNHQNTTSNRTEFVLNESTLSTNYWIRVVGGAPTKIGVFELAHEAAYDAGQVANPNWVLDLAGITTIRMMQASTVLSNKNWPIDFADLIPFDYITWKDGYPVEALAKMANEADIVPWHCFGHQNSDACITEQCNVLKTHLDVGRKVRIEISNEVWNGGGLSYRDQYWWFTSGDVEVQEAVVTPATGNCALVAHGLTTEDQLSGHNTSFINNTGYDGGIHKWAIRIDDDNFKLASSLANATAGTDVVTESGALDAGFIKYRFKNISASLIAKDFNYAARCVDVFALCKDVLGDQLIAVGAGQTANPNICARQLTVAGYREAIDEYATAPYFVGRDMPGFETASFEEINEWTKANYCIANVEPNLVSHLGFLEGIPHTTYEGGEHNGGVTMSTAKATKCVEYARSNEIADMTEWYCSWLAGLNITVYGNFDSHSYFTTGGSGDYPETWGCMEYPRHTTSPKYVGLKVHIDAGGASKP